MAVEPGYGHKITAVITGVKGSCNAGHKTGEQFEIGCWNSAGLCGFFYHSIFADLETFQFGGSLPWWEGNTIEVQCPDTENLVTLRLERSPRE